MIKYVVWGFGNFFLSIEKTDQHRNPKAKYMGNLGTSFTNEFVHFEVHI